MSGTFIILSVFVMYTNIIKRKEFFSLFEPNKLQNLWTDITLWPTGPEQ